MRNRWLLIGGGLLLIAALLVVGQSALNRRAASGGDSSSAAVSAAGEASTAGGAPAAGPASGVDAASEASVSAGRETTQPPVGSRARAIPPLPGGGRLAAIAPEGPARSGARLHPLTSSPAGLLSGVSGKQVPAGSVYLVGFRPWGYGPPSRTGQTVVVSIDTMTARAQAPGVNQFTRAPVLAVMDARNGGDVIVGGRQTATLTFMATERGLVPVLSAVSAPAP